MEKTARQPVNNRLRKAVIVILAAAFLVGLAVALLGPRKEEPVLVKGNLSAQDIQEIKRVALKHQHAVLLSAFKVNLKQKQFQHALDILKEYHRLKVKEIETQGPHTALVTFKYRKTVGPYDTLVVKITNGWQAEIFLQ